jgi:hypothetical protein
MLTIKTRQDIDSLRRGGIMPAALNEHIDGYFRQLEAELSDDEEDTFCLDQHGPIVLLETGDDLRSLIFAGLTDDGCSFYCCTVEYVERLVLGDVQAYKLASLLDNDFLVTFFTQAGVHDEEVEKWLNEQAQRS